MTTENTVEPIRVATVEERDAYYSRMLEMAPQSPFEMVKRFHQVFGHPVATKLTGHPRWEWKDEDWELAKLRLELIKEEFTELRQAILMGDRVEMADALADLAIVVYGAAIAWGIPLDEVIAAAHRSNMSKLGPDLQPIYREDGKIMKGPDYRPPTQEIAQILDLEWDEKEGAWL